MGLRGRKSIELTEADKANIDSLRAMKNGSNGGRLGADSIAERLGLPKKSVRKHLGLAYRGGYYHPTFLSLAPRPEIPDSVLVDRDHRINLPQPPFGDPKPGYSAWDRRNNE